MNEKLNMQDLIDMLAEKHGLSKKNSESFVKEFFGLIEEALQNDNYVKIKGLGTFKLIEVDSRESVNVNTGERFEIQGHTKISFTPEASLKDLVNKPFSHFDTVVLNDDTILDDTAVDNATEDEEADNMPESIEKVIEVQSSVDQTSDEKILVEEPLTEEKKTPEVPFVNLPNNQKENENVVNDKSTMKYFIGIVVFVVLLCGGAVIFMYYPDLLDRFVSKPSTEKVAEEQNKNVPQLNATDTISEENATIVEMDTIKAPSKQVMEQKAMIETSNTTKPEVLKREEKKPEVVSSVQDTAGYHIVGTKATYTVQEGETLTKVALRFYGTKSMWPYIVKHNPKIIKNPDNVPFGTIIKIPELEKK